jgi:hypothetical protein
MLSYNDDDYDNLIFYAGETRRTKKSGLQLMPKDGVQPRVKEGQKKTGRTMNEKTTSLSRGRSLLRCIPPLLNFTLYPKGQVVFSIIFLPTFIRVY